jgi:hypothetical protein
MSNYYNTGSVSGLNIDAMSALFSNVSPALVDYLKVREAELTKRQAIAAQRNVEIEKIRNYTQMMLAAIDGTVSSREILITAVSSGMKDALQANNTEVAMELAKILSGLGNMANSVVEGYKALTGHNLVSEE